MRLHASAPVRARARSLTTVPPARCLPALASQDLRSKREEVNRSILRDEEEKAKIQKELTTMTERLSRINEDLARKMQARVEFDQTIQETEAAYMKILESSAVRQRAGRGREGGARVCSRLCSHPTWPPTDAAQRPQARVDELNEEAQLVSP